jgi:mannose/fructose/N-acetylgalactosamine-specific phosphotransferase system component IIC
MKNNLANNVSFKLNKLPVEVDVLTLVFVIFLVVLICNKTKLPEYTQLCFLLALILLMSCYNIEISIISVIVAIIYVLIQNNRKNQENSN